jgi:hypothetical protein
MDVYSLLLHKVEEAVKEDPTCVNRELVPPRPANDLDPIPVAPLLYALYWRHERSICLFLLRSGANVREEYIFTCTDDWVLRRHLIRRLRRVLIRELRTLDPVYVTCYTDLYRRAPKQEREWFTDYIQKFSTSLSS